MKGGCVLLAALAALSLPATGGAAWSVGRNATGAIGTKVMPTAAPPAPAGSVSSHDVTVTWTGSRFADGTPLPSYVVKRYNTLNQLQTTLAACSGNVAGTSCVEHSVPTGTWKYTVTPAAGTWRGTESPKSANVTVLV